MWPRHTTLALALGLGVASAQCVLAQDVRVNVTGTNIKRVDSETAAPIQTITREDIEVSGLQTISDVVRQITATTTARTRHRSPTTSRRPAAAVSLRGLGPDNTLVLRTGGGSPTSDWRTTGAPPTSTCSRFLRCRRAHRDTEGRRVRYLWLRCHGRRRQRDLRQQYSGSAQRPPSAPRTTAKATRPRGR